MQRQGSDNDLSEIQHPLLSKVNSPHEVHASHNLPDLPGDVLGLIASYLFPNDVAALSATNSKLHQQFTKGRASLIWRTMLVKHFPEVAARQMNQPNDLCQATFAAAYHQHYAELNDRTRWLFTLVAEGDLSGLTEGRPLYFRRNHLFSLVHWPLRGMQAPTSLDEIMKRHRVLNSWCNLTYYYFTFSWVNGVELASRYRQQFMLDHGYSLAQVRYRERNAVSVSESLDADRNQLIHYAASMNQSNETIMALLASGADVNASNRWGETPLIMAAENGHVGCVSALVAADANVNAARSCSWFQDWFATPLSIAVKNGHMECVTVLVAAGANVNGYLDYSESLNYSAPLMIAAYKGDVACVKVLVRAGAIIHTNRFKRLEDVHCHTPLSIAAQNGHEACVNELVAAGADVNATEGFDFPLFNAAANGHEACVSALLASGADVNACSNIILKYNNTPLGAAMSKGHYKVALFLYVAAIEQREDQHYLRSISLFGKTFRGVGMPAREKKSAARVLLQVVNGEVDVEMLQPHTAALSNGRLSRIAKGLGYQLVLSKRWKCMNRLIEASEIDEQGSPRQGQLPVINEVTDSQQNEVMGRPAQRNQHRMKS